MKLLFFFVFLIASGLIPYNQVFATHYSDLGIDDSFSWREWDIDDIYSVWCEYFGVRDLPFDDNRISFGCQHPGTGTYQGIQRYGMGMIMKVFDKADIYNGGTNTFTWRFYNQCDPISCGDVRMSVMDGAYDYTKTTEPGGFLSKVDYWMYNGDPCTTSPAKYYTRSDFSLCMNIVGPYDPRNSLGSGNLGVVGVDSLLFSNAPKTAVKGEQSIAISITNALWTSSTQSQITVFLSMQPDDDAAINNWQLQPLQLTITNTPTGTLDFNFPETTAEAVLWETYGGYGVYQLNGTNSDYGYFWGYDPSRAGPPTDLYAVCSSDCDLQWTAPDFDGYSPITAYKIERESPIGGGFSTIVANTGSTSTTYSDTTITPGTEYNYRVRTLNFYGESIPSNESKDGSPSSGSNPIVNVPNISCNSTGSNFELFAPGVAYNYVDLCWDTIDMNGGNVTGYQVNYTTPWGDPISIVTGLNDTSTTDRTRRINNLQASTDYSFRVALWSDNTFNNQTNIVNVTTQSTAFNVGNYTFTGDTNTETLDFKWSKNIVSANQTEVNVEFPTSYSVDCSINLLLAQTELNYTSISETTLTTSTSYHTFTFDDPDNDVIKISCWNSSTPEQVSNYVLTNNVSSIPLIEQIQNFRAGTWGTEGQVGAFDLITLVVIILSMLAFNRTNPVAGAIVSLIILGVAAFFQIIQWYSAIGGLIAVGVVLALAAHNKGDTD